MCEQPTIWNPTYRSSENPESISHVFFYKNVSNNDKCTKLVTEYIPLTEDGHT